MIVPVSYNFKYLMTQNKIIKCTNDDNQMALISSKSNKYKIWLVVPASMYIRSVKIPGLGDGKLGVRLVL